MENPQNTEWRRKGFTIGPVLPAATDVQWSQLELRARVVNERDVRARAFGSTIARLDAALSARLAATTPVDPHLLAAWRRLDGGGEAVGVATLAEELGWSRRHLSVRFRREFGLPPRTVARLLRFDRAYASLGRTVLTAPSAVPDDTGWAERAARWGYYDQSHLIREFREFAGVTPAALAGPGSHSSNPA